MAAHHIAARADAFFGSIKLLQQLLAALKKLFAQIRQGQATSRAMHQLHPQPTLQRGQAPPHDNRRDALGQDRKSVVSGKSVSERVDPEGRSIIKKKQPKGKRRIRQTYKK